MSYQDPRGPHRNTIPGQPDTSPVTTRIHVRTASRATRTEGRTGPYPGDPYPADTRGAAPYRAADGYAEKPLAHRGPQVNPATFAGGVVMTGVVTGLAAWLVAWIISAFVEKVNESGKFGVWNPVANSEIWFGVVGFLALAAGALWYVLQLITPAPNQFYRWIVALLLIAAVVIPILTYRQVSVGIETAIVHLVIGLPSLTIIPAMGNKSLQR